MHILFLIMMLFSLVSYTADKYQRPDIFSAQTANQAQKFVDIGALDKLSDVEKYYLFQQAMQPGYDSKLISLYIDQGLNALLLNSPGKYTVLMALAIWPEQDNLLKKARLLLEGLSHKQQCDFIERKTSCGGTVLRIINQQIRYYSKFRPGLDTARQLIALHDFLEKLIEIKKPCKSYNDYHELSDHIEIVSSVPDQTKDVEDTCLICFDVLDIKANKTINGHRVHSTCKAWVERLFKSKINCNISNLN